MFKLKDLPLEDELVLFTDRLWQCAGVWYASGLDCS